MAGAETLIAGRYRIVRPLGAGGMGRVWLGRDESLGRDVAIKEVAAAVGLPVVEREDPHRSTLHEARAAARLNHPNVIRILDVRPGVERSWIVMEYVPSRSLLQLIKENGPLPVEQVAGIGLGVLSALNAARRVGVLHRDVKPSNVLVADDGRVILTDFGSAVVDEGEAATARSGVVVGSPLYIAPERIHSGVSTPQSDLWSLGATLYHAVEGRPPFSRGTIQATLDAVAGGKPDPTRRAGPLSAVLKGVLQRNPKSRMAPAEIEDRLRRLADVQTTVHLRHVPQRRRPVAPGGGPAGAARRRPAGRRPPPFRWRLLTLAAVSLALVVLTVLVLATDRGPRSGAGSSPEAAERRPAAPSGTAGTSAGAPSATPATFALPARFAWWNGPKGWRVAVPVGWRASRSGVDVAVFAAPGGQPVLRVGAWSPPNPDLVTALVARERAARLPGYRRIRIEALTDPPGAGWEYTFTDRRVGRVRAMERAVVAGGRTYLIGWRTPAATWPADLHRLGVVVHSLRSVRSG
jgi:eukaryotic-like serine/threonine-protein kinase